MNALVMNCSPVRTGATAEIAHTISDCLKERYDVRNVCIDDFNIHFCKGCRSCHHTAECIQRDDTDSVIRLYKWADVIVSVSPSYWADIPGQFKAFIDRCTPWCNTHEPHASIGGGKRGYSVALRTGPSMRECDRIIEMRLFPRRRRLPYSSGQLRLPSSLWERFLSPTERRRTCARSWGA